MISRVPAVALLAAALAWPVLGQTPVPPVFRAGVELVTLDVRVLDRQGRPIRGLRPEEFQVDLDGQRRPVQAAEYIEFATARTPAPVRSAIASSPFEPAALAEDPGRSILIAFDDLSFRTLQGSALLSDVGAWLARLDPRDRVGVTTMSGIGPADIIWTRDRPEVLDILRGLVGRRDTGGGPRAQYFVTIEEAFAFRGVISPHEFLTITQAAAFWAANPGAEVLPQFAPEVAVAAFSRECTGDLRPPPPPDDPEELEVFLAFLVCYPHVISAARDVRMAAEMEAIRQLSGFARVLDIAARAPSPKMLVLLSRGLAVENMSDINQFVKAARNAGLAVYALGPAGDPFDPEVPPKNSAVGLTADDLGRRNDAFGFLGLESVAGAAGGSAHRVVGSADRFLDRILVETSGYYRLGVEPPPGRRNWMSAKVTTRRGAASIAAADRVARPGAPPEAVVSAPASVEDQLEGLLRRGGPTSGMLVELATSLGRDPSGQRLRITANARLREDHAGPLKAMFALVALGGAIVSSGGLTMVERRDAPGFRAAFHVPVFPGRYQLRFAVADASGRFGATQQEVSARLKRIGSYYVSDLVLPWAGADNQLQYPELDELPSVAVTLRPMLELYAGGAEPTAVPRVRLVIEPAGGGAALVDKDMETIVGGTVARARVDVAVRSLPPGQYVVHATVFESGEEAGRVSANLRVAAPASR